MEITSGINDSEETRRSKGKAWRYYYMKSKVVLRHIRLGYIKLHHRVEKPSRSTTIKLFRKYFEPRVHLTDIATVFTNLNKTLKHCRNQAEYQAVHKRITGTTENIHPSLPPVPNLMLNGKSECAQKDRRKSVIEYLDEATGLMNKHHNKQDFIKKTRFCDPYEFDDTEKPCDLMTPKHKTGPSFRRPSESRQVESFMKNASIVLKIRTSQDGSHEKSPKMTQVPSPGDSSDPISRQVKTEVKTAGKNHTDFDTGVSTSQKEELTKSPQLSDCNGEFDSVIEGVSEENFIDEEDEANLVVDEDAVADSLEKAPEATKNCVDKPGNCIEKAGQNKISVSSAYKHEDNTGSEKIVKKEPETVTPEDFFPEIVSVTSLYEGNGLNNACGFTKEPPKPIKRRKRKIDNKSCDSCDGKTGCVKKTKVQKQTKVNLFHQINELKRQGRTGEFIEVKPIKHEQVGRISVKQKDTSDPNFIEYHQQNGPAIYAVNNAQKCNLPHTVPVLEHPLHSSQTKVRRRRKSSKPSTKTSSVKRHPMQGASSVNSKEIDTMQAKPYVTMNEERRGDSPGIAAPERLVQDFVNHNWLIQKYQINQTLGQTEKTVGIKSPLSQAVTIEKDRPTFAVADLTKVSSAQAPSILVPLQQFVPGSQIAALKFHQKTCEPKLKTSNTKASFSNVQETKTEPVQELMVKPPVKDCQQITINPILPKLSPIKKIGTGVQYTSSGVPSRPKVIHSIVPSSQKPPLQKVLNTISDKSLYKSNKSSNNVTNDISTTTTALPSHMAEARPSVSTEDTVKIHQKSKSDVMDLSVPTSKSSENKNTHTTCKGNQAQQQSSSESLASEKDGLLIELKKQFQHFEKMYQKLEKLEEIKERETQQLKSQVQQASLQMDQIQANINRLVEENSKSVVRQSVTEDKSQEKQAEEDFDASTVVSKVAVSAEQNKLTCEVLDLSRKFHSDVLTGYEKVVSKSEDNVAAKPCDLEVSAKEKPSRDSKLNAIKVDSEIHSGLGSKDDDMSKCMVITIDETKNNLKDMSTAGSPLEKKVNVTQKLPQYSIPCKNEESKEQTPKIENDKEFKTLSHNQDAITVEKNVKPESKETGKAILKEFSLDVVNSIIEELITKSVTIVLVNNESDTKTGKEVNSVENSKVHSIIEEQVQNTLKHVIGPNKSVGRIRGKSRFQRGMSNRYRGPPNITFGNRAALPFMQETVQVEQRHLLPQFAHQPSVNRPMHMPMVQLRLPVQRPQTTSIQRPIQPMDQSQLVHQIQPMPNTCIEHPQSIYQPGPTPVIPQSYPNSVLRPPSANFHAGARPARIERPGVLTQSAVQVVNQTVQRSPHPVYQPFAQQHRFQQNNHGWLRHQHRPHVPDPHGNQLNQSQSKSVNEANVALEDRSMLPATVHKQSPFQESKIYPADQNGTFSNQAIGKHNLHVGISQNHSPYVDNHGNHIVVNNGIQNVGLASANGVNNMITHSNTHNNIQNHQQNSVLVQAGQNGSGNHSIKHNPSTQSQSTIETAQTKQKIQNVKTPPAYPGKPVIRKSIVQMSVTSEPDSEKPSKNLKKNPQCSVCSKRAIFICSGCKKVPYCSQKCQNEAWRTHSRDCK